jgi:solute carrier family 35 protein F5
MLLPTCLKGRISPSYALGLTFIVVVCIIWALSSTLVQYMYSYSSEDEEDEQVSAFLVTYIGVSLFTLFLPLKLCRKSFPKHPVLQTADLFHFHQLIETSDQMIDIVESFDPTLLYLHVQDTVYWTNSQHFFTAAKIAPVWFLTNWCYNSALSLTSMSSSTTLASTTSAFAFGMEVFMGEERFGLYKLAGVIMGLLGTSLTGVHDSLHPDEDAANDRLIGDFVAVLAALGFATYAVQIRTLFPDNARYSMKVILGYIGAINTIALSPLAIYQVLHKPNGMDSRIVALAMLRGIFDYVLSEYLFFRAVLLTSATVASVGLGLTIPMAFLADYILGVENFASVYSIGGALCILIGFLLVNVPSSDPDNNDNVTGILPTKEEEDQQAQIMEQENDPQPAPPRATQYELQGLSTL